MVEGHTDLVILGGLEYYFAILLEIIIQEVGEVTEHMDSTVGSVGLGGGSTLVGLAVVELSYGGNTVWGILKYASSDMTNFLIFWQY